MATCRSCGSADLLLILDLGLQPSASEYPSPSDSAQDRRWPLKAGICRACWLVQLLDDDPDEDEVPGAPPPTESATMAQHARLHVSALIDEGLIRPGRRILGIASHGGHLAPFLREAGISVTALEPNAHHAERIGKSGASVVASGLLDFADLIGGSKSDDDDGSRWDLIIDNYLLAHLRAPDSALKAIERLLSATGAVIFEFDHVLPTLEGRQVDGIRHGHRSYLSLTWLTTALRRHRLEAVSARILPVYGGSLRVLVQRAGAPGQLSDSVTAVLAQEAAAGLATETPYLRFAQDVRKARHETIAYLRSRAAAGIRVLGYGAPARATTLLNWYGIGTELLGFTADASPAKQGRSVPGVRLPIRSPGDLLDAHPDEVLILAWDLAGEIAEQLRPVRERGGRLLTPFPTLGELDGNGMRQDLGGAWGARLVVPIPTTEVIG